MRSIGNPSLTIKEQYQKVFKLNWVFTEVYEKIILVGCILWAMYSIVRWIIG